MQPTYIPWLGYFDLMDCVNSFVFLNDVQWAKWSWQVRNRIKTSQGELFLTVPIKRGRKSRLETSINEAQINDTERWREKHLKSIFVAYRKGRYFDEVFPFLETMIGNKSEMLDDFNMNIISGIARKIGITTAFSRASELENAEGKKDSRLVNMCRAMGCQQYISPQGSAEYIERGDPGGAFAGSGVTLFYQNYRHPVYRQLYGDFLPQMSVIDLMFNEGCKATLPIIRSGRVAPIHYAEFRKSHEKKL